MQFDSLGPDSKCTVCGEHAELCCSDCAIDLKYRVYLCGKPACFDEHERREKAGTVVAETHAWDRQSFSYPACSRCGVVMRKDGKNKPCRGLVTVSLREQ